MPDASPTRWHLAHTTWFFETFVLKQLADFVPYDASFESLFNSYYNAIGAQYPRERRGLVSRPGLNQILDYRCQVDQRLLAALTSGSVPPQLLSHIELGLQHEQQHQELILTDIKHALWCNPLFPAYNQTAIVAKPLAVADQAVADGVVPAGGTPAVGLCDVEVNEGFACFAARLAEVGYGADGFAFDNETPRHQTYLHDYALATKCVTNGEFHEFIEQGGYARPEWWLSLGWQQVQARGWQAPLYWVRRDDGWYEYSLSGLVPLQWDAPVCHVSYFEADAFARWAGKRLPTEFEWEVASDWGGGEYFADRLLARGEPLHPRFESPASEFMDTNRPLSQMFGNVWEWTSSQYAAYPGFAAGPGALGEYNGKFMCNQFVLRGGSCASSADHLRPSYRNFFPPEARWQFSGFRLAESRRPRN
jgi:ergothioneine biosynthesis protein EgtB